MFDPKAIKPGSVIMSPNPPIMNTFWIVLDREGDNRFKAITFTDWLRFNVTEVIVTPEELALLKKETKSKIIPQASIELFDAIFVSTKT